MKAALKTLRVLDEDGTISLTTLLVVSLTAFLLISPSQISLAAFSLVVLNVNAKRFSRHQAKLQADKTLDITKTEKTRIDSIEVEVQKLIQASNISKLGR